MTKKTNIQKNIQFLFPLITIVIAIIGAHSLIYDNIILDILLHMSLGMMISGLIFIAEW